MKIGQKLLIDGQRHEVVAVTEQGHDVIEPLETRPILRRRETFFEGAVRIITGKRKNDITTEKGRIIDIYV